MNFNSNAIKFYIWVATVGGFLFILVCSIAGITLLFIILNLPQRIIVKTIVNLGVYILIVNAN